MKRPKDSYTSEPQALINVCLNCPLLTCKPDTCKRYNNAKIRLKFNLFPLVEEEVNPTYSNRCKCAECIFGEDCGGKFFCPLIRGTCVKED